MRATAQAHANIALIKYWGKRDEALILPEAGSFSVALDLLRTTTTVELGARADFLEVDGTPQDPAGARAVLDAAGIRESARIVSRNDFPAAAGLASSASCTARLRASIRRPAPTAG